MKGSLATVRDKLSAVREPGRASAAGPAVHRLHDVSSSCPFGRAWELGGFGGPGRAAMEAPDLPSTGPRLMLMRKRGGGSLQSDSGCCWCCHPPPRGSHGPAAAQLRPRGVLTCEPPLELLQPLSTLASHLALQPLHPTSSSSPDTRRIAASSPTAPERQDHGRAHHAVTARRLPSSTPFRASQ